MEVLNVGGADISVSVQDDGVAIVEMRRPPNNFFDAGLIRAIADAYATLDEHPSCRAIVLCAEGKHFCAGANFGSPRSDDRPREDVPRARWRGPCALPGCPGEPPEALHVLAGESSCWRWRYRIRGLPGRPSRFQRAFHNRQQI